MSPYSQGPPPPGTPGRGPGPFSGQQPWTPYPGQQLGPGMPMAPPPRRRHGLVWTVVGLVVVLVAAGVTYLLVQKSTDDGPNDGDGTAQDGGECTGDYCVGGYPYVNACGVFDPSSVVSLIGSAGSGRVNVRETYADPLPQVEDPARAAWTYGLTSTCHVAPEDVDGAVFHSVQVELKQTAAEAPAPSEGGRPLEGVDGALVEDLEGRARVHWQHRNVSAILDVTWTNRKPAISDATMAGAVNAITRGLANPPSEPRALGELSEGGQRVVIDACTVFTGEDFQSATRYAVNPTNVHRNYSTTFSGALITKCSRFTAPPNAGLPAPDGITFLDGSMFPNVTVAKHPDPPAAMAELSANKERIDGAVDIPGIGAGAVFGVSGSRFTLQFTAGFHLVTVDCGLSNGNADWTAEDMRSRLEPLAAAIATRMR